MNKNIVIGVLSLMIVILGGYLVYDKIYLKDNTELNIKESAINDTSNKQSSEKEYILDYTKLPTESDDTAIIIKAPENLLSESELATNFTSITKEVDGITLNYSCTNFGLGDNEEDDTLRCTDTKIKIDNLIEFTSNTPNSYAESSTYKIIKSGKYYVLDETDAGVSADTLKFYNSLGKEVYKYEYVYGYDNIVISDSVLYFKSEQIFTSPYGGVNDKQFYTYSYVDLTKDNITVNEFYRVEIDND
jgi:uncharacterized protein YxeA